MYIITLFFLKNVDSILINHNLYICTRSNIYATVRMKFLRKRRKSCIVIMLLLITFL